MTCNPLPLRAFGKPRRGAVLVGSLALVLLTSSPAAYAKKPTPTPTPTTTMLTVAVVPDLAISFTGPAEGTAGTTAEWTLTVRNHGDAAASGFSVTTRLPAGMFVARARPADRWTCVLGSTATPEAGQQPIPDLSCSLDGLGAGETAPALSVILQYGRELVGPQQVAAEVTQAEGEPADALADNRSTQTTTLAAATPPPIFTAGVAGPHAPITPPEGTPKVPAIDSVTGNPSLLPYTGAGTATGITLSAALILLGAALICLGRRRYVPRPA